MACDIYERCAVHAPTRTDTLYFATSNTIQRRSLPNGNPTTLYTNIGGAITGFALDSAHNTMYFAEGANWRAQPERHRSAVYKQRQPGREKSQR